MAHGCVALPQALAWGTSRRDEPLELTRVSVSCARVGDVLASLLTPMLQLTEIQNRLADYLGTPLLSLKVLASGWETTVFEFTVPAAIFAFPGDSRRAPLVLRFYQGPFADAKGVARTLHHRETFGCRLRRSEAVPYEPNHDVLGAPFLIMERIEGGPLFSHPQFPQRLQNFLAGIFRFRARAGPASSDGVAQVRARRDPPRVCSRGHRCRMRRSSIACSRSSSSASKHGPLPGLKEAHARLAARAAEFRTAPLSLLHLDYHPQNVVVKGMRVTGVIDWVNTDIGDRHLDAATTAAILSSSALRASALDAR